MKKFLKRSLSLAVCVAILIASLTSIGVSVLAAGNNEVTVKATAGTPITITPKATLPEKSEEKGILELVGGTFDIDRDYAQKCMVSVRNTSNASVEYYLTVNNIYSDIYLNFVRSGSVDIPLVIAAGESQQIQLDVFTQNAQRGQYTLPVYAHTVEDGSETVDAMTTVYLNVPTVDLRVLFSKKSSDPHTLAQVFTLRNNGSEVSDLTIKADDSIKDYVFFSPGYSTYPLKSGETIEFTVSPDLYKMKTNNLTKLEGQLIASAGGSETSVNVSFDTQGQEITTTTMGKIVEYQLGKHGDFLSTNAQHTIKPNFIYEEKNEQCTNAGKVSSHHYAPPTGSNIITTSDNEEDNNVRLFITSRMYGGNYVDKTETNYDYYINGKFVSRSHNSGLTELSIAELPIDNIKFGATNTIIRDYDTNPGSHSVTSDTEIVFVYPYDTPISYIGSPDSLPDYRPLPDFCVYSENIFNATPDIVKGVESELTVNIYNRGSAEGTFNIEIKDGNEVVYQEENHELEDFSGDVISFAWTPTQNSHTITVKLTNTTEGMPDRNESNNTASKTFSVRPRQVPRINSITPDYLVEGENIVYATVSNYADITKAEFYVDGKLYTGEISSSVYNGMKRYWINDSDLAQGKHTVRVVIYYINDDDVETQVESSKDFSVLPVDWDKYTFALDEDIANLNCLICDKKNHSYRRIYSILRSGKQYTISLTKAEYDSPEDYILTVYSGDTLLLKSLSDDGVLKKSDCRKVVFQESDVLKINSVYLCSIDNNSVSVSFNKYSSLTFSPGVYEFEISLSYMGEYRTVRVNADITSEDAIIDLSEYFTKFDINFADEINGNPSVKVLLFNSQNKMQEIIPLTKKSGNDLLAVVSKADQYSFDNSVRRVLCVKTDDVLLTADVKSGSNRIAVDKMKLQKYNLSAGSFTVTEVLVENKDISEKLYSPTIYLTPGEYDITAYCKDLGENELITNSFDGIVYAPQSTAEKENIITFKIPKAFDRYASIYATGSDGNVVSDNAYFSGNKISALSDIYRVNIGLNRDSAKYSVIANVDATKSNDILIGNTFFGTIDNSFGSYESYSKISLYLNNLKDDYGNYLSEFISKDDSDNLKGTVTFTNVKDESDVHSLTVNINSLSDLEIVLPDLDGQYSVSLLLANDSNFKNLNCITLSDMELTLHCNRKYKMNAEMNPADYQMPHLIWTSENENIATVDESGVITTSAENIGETVITVQTEDGAYSAQCAVTVKYSFLQMIRQICIKIFNAIEKIGARISQNILDLLNRG